MLRLGFLLTAAAGALETAADQTDLPHGVTLGDLQHPEPGHGERQKDVMEGQLQEEFILLNPIASQQVPGVESGSTPRDLLLQIDGYLQWVSAQSLVLLHTGHQSDLGQARDVPEQVRLLSTAGLDERVVVLQPLLDRHHPDIRGGVAARQTASTEKFEGGNTTG